MEEENNQPVEENAGENEVAENSQPTREDVLAASRAENKHGDEMEMQWLAKAGTLAFSFGLLLAGIIELVTVIVKGYSPYEVLLIVCGMQTVNSLIVGIRGAKKTKKLYLALGGTFGVLTVIFTVFWILQLCGVMV